MAALFPDANKDQMFMDTAHFHCPGHDLIVDELARYIQTTFR
jgi:hypothetical protein